jgi:hypothetical protein
MGLNTPGQPDPCTDFTTRLWKLPHPVTCHRLGNALGLRTFDIELHSVDRIWDSRVHGKNCGHSHLAQAKETGLSSAKEYKRFDQEIRLF